jgi:hypothetical protein
MSADEIFGIQRSEPSVKKPTEEDLWQANRLAAIESGAKTYEGKPCVTPSHILANGRTARFVEWEAIERLKDQCVLCPFDPRTEVSADAIHIASRIVMHLWIIFVLLPFVAVLLLYVTGAIK